MYVVRTRSLGDNLSTLGLSTSKPVAKATPREAAHAEGAKDASSKADEAPTDAYNRLAGSAPAAKGCLLAFEALKKPKLTAREKKLAELDNFYGAGPGKAPSPKVVQKGFDLDEASDNPS